MKNINSIDNSFKILKTIDKIKKILIIACKDPIILYKNNSEFNSTNSAHLDIIFSSGFISI